MKLSVLPTFLTATMVFLCPLETALAVERNYSVDDVSKVRAPQSVFTEKDYFKYADWRLYNIKEPSLWNASKDPNERTFRFIYLPVEKSGLSIRIDFDSASKAKLTWKIFEGRSADAWGSVQKTGEVDLTETQIELFEFEFNRLNYWHLERSFEDGQKLGVLWLMEFAEYGKYHAVPKIKPDQGRIYEFERFVVRLSGLENPPLDAGKPGGGS